jgi:TolA-binding protein
MLKALPQYPNPERVLLKIAESAANGGAAADVLPRLQAVVEAAPTSGLAAEARFRMAKMHEAQGENDNAMALYEAAADSNTGDVAARSRFRLAELLEAAARHEDAASNFMRVAILYLHEELSPQALLRAGVAYEAAGKPGQAKKAYEELVRDFASAPAAAQAQEALTRLGGV